MPTPDEILLVEARLLDTISPAIKKAGRATKTALDKMSRDAQKMNQRFTTMTSKILNVKNAIIGLAAVKGIQLLLGSVAKLGDGFDKMSQRLNVSTQFLQEMDFVANLAGTSFQTLEGGMRRLARNANDANDGLAASKRAFEDIGVSVQGANGNLKESEELFNDVLIGLAGLEDKTKQTALAQVLFGRSGASLIPILNQGADAIAAQRKQVNELGGVMSTSAIKAAVDYTDSMTRLQFAFRGIQANLVAPALASISTAVEEFIANGGIDKIKASIDFMITSGKILFTVFAANKILAMSSAFVQFATSVALADKKLAALKINPAILAITAAVVAMELLTKQVERAGDRLNQLSDTFGDIDKEQKLLELRKQFDALNASGNASVKTMGFYGIEITKSSEAMIKLEAQAKAIQGFTFASKEGQRQTVDLLEKRIRVTDSLAKKEADVAGLGGGGGADVAGDAQRKAAEKLAEDIKQIRLAGLQRTFEGRIEILNTQEDMLLERARGNEEQLSIIREEFALRNIDEQQAEAEKRLEIEKDLADKIADVEKAKATTMKKRSDETKALEAKNVAIREDNLKTRIAGERALTDALISQGARGLQGLIKNEKAAQGIAFSASVIQGILAVQRAIAAPPGPPFTLPGALAVGVQAAGNSAAIASQAFADGGFPVGRNVNALLNEQGQESVLNAQATASLGTGNINRINSGRGGGNIITNEISYSPTLEINSDTNQDFISVLSEDKERFGKFFNEEIVDKGFLER